MMRYNKNKRKYYSTSNMIISRPLLPPVQKVCLKYYTRFHIDPVAVLSGATATAHDMPIHTFAWNDPYDIDKTHSLVTSTAGSTTGRQQDGAPDHQPRMYDQYSSFYDKITVIGARAKVCFSNSNRTMISTTDHVAQASHPQTITENITRLTNTDPLPTFVGYLTSQYTSQPTAHVKWDNVREKNQVRYRRLCDKDKPIKMTANWSIKKDPVFRTKLPLLADHEAPENFTADFGNHPTNMRFLHLFAHPCTVSNASNPAPVDVEVEISQICLLSERKEVGQS